MIYSNSEIVSFNKAGVIVENKNYTNGELRKLKIRLKDFIINQSVKDI